MPVWDVSQVAPSDQFGYWREVICQAFVPLAPKAAHQPRGFASRVELRPVGGLSCAVISSRPQHTAHGPAEVRRTAGAYYFVNLQLAGECAVRQRERRATVRAGEFCVLDTTEPYYLDFPGEWRMVSFRVPHAELDARLPDAGHGMAAAVGAGTGPGLVVGGLLRSLWQLGGTPEGGESDHWTQSFAAAVAGALVAAPVRGELADGDLRLVIERYVLANLTHRDLSVPAVAARFGISPRTLHNVFGGGESYARTVRRARLRRCAELLADAGRAGSVAEVGARYGFGDPTAFSRAFRREFGVTPSEVRRSGRPPAVPLAHG